jgi:hypothetical protein
MPFFWVDDKLHSHPKAIKAGARAIGLWTLAGSWSNDQGTDGFVPDYMVSRWDSQGKRIASTLVAVGLWETAKRGDETGWRFHEWEGDGIVRRNYTRAEVEQRRREGAERQSKSRQRRMSQSGHVTRDTSVTDTVTDKGVAYDKPVSHTDPSPPLPSLRSKPVTQDVAESLTRQDHGDGKTIDDEDRGGRGPIGIAGLRKAWCDEHSQPDDRDCPACQDVYGDRTRNAKKRAGLR